MPNKKTQKKKNAGGGSNNQVSSVVAVGMNLPVAGLNPN